MKQTLSLQNLIAMGFMVFSMFLGAGNLIFPPLAGYLAGTNIWQATAGFLITGVGLPLLGVVAISKVGGGFNSISQELPRWIIIILGACMFMIIGPLYAVPRTAMVAYEIGILPFLNNDINLNNAENTTTTIAQALFSLVFFIISWYLCLNPGKLLESVGKIITPALIILLTILGISPFFGPTVELAAPSAQYIQSPFLRGFFEGYLTMDGLAALMFGVVITTNLKSHGITEKKALVRYSIFTGIIAAAGLGLVYISLFYLGATTQGIEGIPSNGTEILVPCVKQMFGSIGSILLSMVVILACLTTAVGCITAASEYFDGMTGSFKYSWMVTIVSIISLLLANLSLNKIIILFTPVLFLLYPTCISLILLGLIRQHMPNPTTCYRATLLVTFIFSLIDSAQTLKCSALSSTMESLSVIPGFTSQLSWPLPAFITLIASALIGYIFMAKNTPTQKE